MKKLRLLLLLLLASFASNAQSYLGITGFTASTSTSNNSVITFQMTANVSVFVDTVYIRTTGTSGDYRLWYSTTSITGPPNISTPDWVELQAAYNTTTGNNLANDPNVAAVPIPGGLLVNAGTTLRFASGSIQSSVSYTSTTPPVDTFTDGNVTIRIGTNISYAGTFPTPTLHPRFPVGGVYYRFATGRDLRASALVAPTTLTVGPNQVIARFQNSAADPIFSADLGYQVNNDPPVIVTNYGFSPTLGPGNTGDYTFAVPINVTGNTNLTLKVWGVNANGLGADINTSNDTLTRNLCTGLSGVYTVGGSLANFPTITAAVNALNTCGITGSVTFQINDGTYYGSYNIGNVPGAGGTNQITFVSASGIAQNVVLIQDTVTPISGARNHFTVNVPNVTFNGLTFTRTVIGTALSGCVFANAGATGVTITSCRFIDQSASSSTFNQAVRIEAANFANITGNYFDGFYYDIFANGITTNSAYTQGLVVAANIMENYRYGFYGINQSAISVVGNTLNNVNSASTFGYGLYTSRTIGLDMSNNKVLGRIGNMGIYIINPNRDTANFTQNRVYNNVISGTADVTTTIVSYGIYLSGSYSTSTTVVPLNPHDQISFANNTVNLVMSSTSTTVYGAGMHLLGGSATTPAVGELQVLNNNIAIRAAAGSLQSNIKGIYYAGTWLLDSTLANNNNVWTANATGLASGTDLFWNNDPATGYTTVAAWNTATGKDALSQRINPDFISAALAQPTSLPLDNKGTPISWVTSDIDGITRSATTPDIGAYEFVGLQFSQINVTPLGDTVIAGTGRLMTVQITDSTGLVTGTNGPRMYYRKNSGSWQVDSLPSVSGNNFTFTFSYTAVGGVAALDTMYYYFATYNNVNVVTTSPLGGSGTNPIGNTPPPSLYDYKLLGQASGNYLVGTSNPAANFPTLTAAANFLNNSLVVGPVNFILIDTLYNAARGEVFPIVFNRRPGMSPANVVTIRPDSALTATTLTGTMASSTALLSLNGVTNFVLDGASGGTTARKWSIVGQGSNATTAVVWVRSTLAAPSQNIGVRNLTIVGGSNTVTSTMGLYLAGNTVSTAGTGDSLANISIQNVGVRRVYYGIFTRGTTVAPGSNLVIENCEVGSTDTANFVIFRGIDVQNYRGAQIRDNQVYNLASSTATTQAAIEVGGTASNQVWVQRNRIWGVKNLNTGGWGAYGINVLSGDSVRIVNNVIYDLRTVNYSNTSNSFNALGIRLAGGTNHRVHYNSVYLYGAYTNTTTAGAAAAAFCITSTAVTADVRNNVFAVNDSSTTAASYFMAVWLPASYNFANITLNNNAYQVPVHPQNYVGKVGITAATGNHVTVADWKAVSSVGNANNDAFSVPPIGNSLPPFVSLTNLTVPAGTTTGIESGGVVIAALGTPNTDFNNTNRPAGTGFAPDMGAFEFNGVALPDQFPPTIDSILLTPRADQCVVTARAITVFARDNLGGRGIDSVWLAYSIDSIAQPRILFTRTSGTAANGVWSGTMPAAPSAGRTLRGQIFVRDSLANFAVSSNLGTFRDDYIVISAGNDTTINAGDSVTVRAAGAFGARGFLGDPTLAATTNCGGGFMFDMRATGAGLFITGFDLLPNNTGAQTVNVFYRIGGKTGFQANQAAWVQEGSYPITVTSNTTPFNLQINGFTVPAGAVVGVYLQYHSRYATGSTNLSNSDLIIDNGEGFCTNWTVCCSPRAWVGRVYYGSPVTYSWRNLAGTTLAIGDSMRVGPQVTTSYVLVGTDSICTKTDTVTVFVTPNNIDDIGVTQLLAPTAVPALNQPYAVKVVIRNFGNTPATGFDVAYSVGGAELNANAISRTVAPGDTIHHIFTQSWTPTAGGTVRLCAYSKWSSDVNLANDTTCGTFLNVSVEEQAGLVSRVYPNPADGFVKFDFGSAEGVGTLEIRDQLGRVVYSNQVDLSTGATHEVKTREFAAGVYNYRFVLEGKMQQGQVAIRR